MASQLGEPCSQIRSLVAVRNDEPLGQLRLPCCYSQYVDSFLDNQLCFIQLHLHFVTIANVIGHRKRGTTAGGRSPKMGFTVYLSTTRVGPSAFPDSLTRMIDIKTHVARRGQHKASLTKQVKRLPRAVYWAKVPLPVPQAQICGEGRSTI